MLEEVLLHVEQGLGREPRVAHHLLGRGQHLHQVGQRGLAGSALGLHDTGQRPRQLAGDADQVAQELALVLARVSHGLHVHQDGLHEIRPPQEGQGFLAFRGGHLRCLLAGIPRAVLLGLLGVLLHPALRLLEQGEKLPLHLLLPQRQARALTWLTVIERARWASRSRLSVKALPML